MNIIMEDEYELQKLKIQYGSVKSVEYYMKNLLILLRHLLIWPYNSFTPLKYLWVLAAVTTFLVTNFLLIVTEIIAVIVGRNLQQFANGIGTLGLHTTGFVKWSFCIKRSQDLIDLMNQLEKCHLLSKSIDNREKARKNYEEILEDIRWNVNMLVNIWPCYVGYGVIHWLTNPLILRNILKDFDMENTNTTTLSDTAFPFIAWYPWDVNKSHNYFYTYLLQAIGGFASGLGTASFDVFYVSLLIFTSGQLRYLNTSLCYTDDDSSNEWETGLGEKLRKSIVQHTEVTQFLNNMETLLNPMMFIQCLETLTVICLLSFQASAIHLTADVECAMKLTSMVEYFLGAAVQLYLFCFYATRIKYLGLEVAQSVYSCGWEIISNEKNFKTVSSYYRSINDIECLMNMMTVRAQKPFLLTGGPFYELSLETFKSIMGMAVSNSVILRQAAESD